VKRSRKAKAGQSWGEWERERQQGILRLPRITVESPAGVPAIDPAAKSAQDWLIEEVERRLKVGDVPTKAELFAKQLEQQMIVDVKAGKCRRMMSYKSIRVQLYHLEYWPLKKPIIL
jgi:hypothetical protein